MFSDSGPSASAGFCKARRDDKGGNQPHDAGSGKHQSDWDRQWEQLEIPDPENWPLR